MLKEKITILGGGISGMITALALADCGISSCIIEKASLSTEEFVQDLRSTALSLFSVKLLKNYNIWPYLVEYVNPMTDIIVLDVGQSRASLHFTASSVGELAMGYMIKNVNLRQALHKAVRNNSLIKLMTNLEYTDIVMNDQINVVNFSDGNKIGSELLIVSDGRFSKAKQQIFGTNINKDYAQQAIIFNITHQHNHNNTAVEYFAANGPLALLPLQGGFESAVVLTQDNTTADILMSLSAAEFRDHTNQILNGCVGKFEINSAITAYPISASLVDHYYKNNIAIIADAAHNIHPLAGQGLNLGIKDIAVLVPIIKDCIYSGVAFLDMYFSKYNKQRRGGNLRMYYITDYINSIFLDKSTMVKTVRKIGLSVIENIPYLKKQTIKYAMGVKQY